MITTLYITSYFWIPLSLVAAVEKPRCVGSRIKVMPFPLSDFSEAYKHWHDSYFSKNATHDFYPMSASSNVCGTFSEHFQPIIAGEEAPRLSWPWQVKMIHRSHDSQVFLCGGTLIADQWILTAAHCVKGGDPKNTTIGLGRVLQDSKDRFLKVLTAEKLFIHPEYDSTFVEDIALVKLPVAITYNDYIRPACLPPARHIDLASPLIVCYATGYGRTSDDKDSRPSVLHQIQVTVTDFWQCKYRLSSVVWEKHVCIHTPSRDNGVCSGDSGGPLSCFQYGGSFFVAGIFSFVIDKCEDKTFFPDVLEKVSAHLPWIRSVILKESTTLPPDWT